MMNVPWYVFALAWVLWLLSMRMMFIFGKEVRQTEIDDIMNSMPAPKEFRE